MIRAIYFTVGERVKFICSVIIYLGDASSHFSSVPFVLNKFDSCNFMIMVFFFNEGVEI